MFHSRFLPSVAPPGDQPIASVQDLASRGQKILQGIYLAIVGTVVLGLLVGGLYALQVFLDSYDPPVSELRVASEHINGRADVTDPDEIYRLLFQHSLSEDSTNEARDASRPLWVLFKTSSASMNFRNPVVIDIRSVRSDSFRFWLIPRDRKAQAVDVSMHSRSVGSGIYLDLPAQNSAYDIVGSVDTKFYYTPKILVWENASAELLDERFTTSGIAYWAAFLTLSAVSLCIAIVNRSMLFLVFSAWLIGSLRVGGIMNGWDLSWIGVDQWNDTTLILLRMVLVAYAFLTGVLFTSLFGVEQTGVLLNRLVRLATYLYLPLLVGSIWLPLNWFLTFIYVSGVFGLLTVTMGIVAVLRKNRTIIAVLYAVSYFVMATGLVSEVLFYSGVFPALADLGINGITSSLASTIVMMVALAAQISEDRSARQQARIGELNALKSLEGVYTRVPVGLFSLSAEGHLSAANPTFREMFDLQEDLKDTAALEKLRQYGFKPMASRFGERSQVHGFEFRMPGEDSSLELCFVVNMAKNENGFEGVIADITARKVAEEKLDYLARHDQVTDALNIRSFEAKLASYLQDGRYAVLGQINFDRLDYLQKIHGRALADKVLVRIYEVLRAEMPEAYIARDEEKFYFLIDGDVLNLVRGVLVNRFRELRQTGVTVGNVELMASLYAGICLLDGEGSAEEAILRANLSCEMAASMPSNPVVVAEHNKNAIIRELEATRFAGGLEDYIKAGRLFLVAQPIVDIQTPGSRPSFEFLLRMRGEQGEVIPPWQFVPAAEKMGVMSRLDRFVLAEAFRLVKSGELDVSQVHHLSVNLSGSSLNDLEFLRDMFDLVASSQVDLSRFCFEVTESVALNSFDRTKEFLGSLKAMGARTAIDDFGAGHSSIHYITELAPDYLKLDGSLITKILTHPVHGLFVRKMVEIADAVGVDCVAEYVETRELETQLIDMGVAFGQGYYYAAPMPIAETSAFCARWAAQSCLRKVSSPRESAAVRLSERRP